MNYCYICRLFLKDNIGEAYVYVKYILLPYYEEVYGVRQIHVQKRTKKYINESVCVCNYHYRQYAPPKKKELHKQSMFTKVWQGLRK